MELWEIHNILGELTKTNLPFTGRVTKIIGQNPKHDKLVLKMMCKVKPMLGDS